MKHGTLYCARRGMPGKKPCPCEVCVPVFLEWRALHQQRMRDARRRREAAVAPEAFPYQCEFCHSPCMTGAGLARHEENCRL